MLESCRRTHYFRAPSCLCAFLDNANYTESVIGIVEAARGPDDSGIYGPILNGQYVAVCERRRCGYSRGSIFLVGARSSCNLLRTVCLELFYGISDIQLETCRKRGTSPSFIAPRVPIEVFLFLLYTYIIIIDYSNSASATETQLHC